MLGLAEFFLQLNDFFVGDVGRTVTHDRGILAGKKDVASMDGVPLCPFHQNKAIRLAKMIEEMIDIKLRERDRKHHFDHSKPPEEHQNELQRSLVDQNQMRAIQVNLAGAI